MINRVIIVGRLTKDPVLRKTQSGASITSFTVACDRRVKADNQPTADFINCVAWNKTADIVNQYCHKGSLVGAEGRIQTRTYDDASGKRVFVTEVVVESVQFLDTKSSQQSNESNYASQYSNDVETSHTGNDTLEISSEDLPF